MPVWRTPRNSQPPMRLGSPAFNTGRRTNKLLKSREKVWPEHLEKALLEALAAYRPTSTRDPRSLQRFPRRNKWISQRIEEQTGIKRTPKQVGSRLQQLRETCPDPKVLHLIQSKDFGDQPVIYDSANSSPTLPFTTVGEWSLSKHSFPPSLDNRALSRFSSVSSSDFSQGTSSSSSTSLPVYSFRTVLDVSLTLFEFDFCAPSPNAGPSFTLDLDEHALTDYISSPVSPYHTFTHRAEVRTARAISQCTPVVNFSSQRFLPNDHYQCITEVGRDGELVYSRPVLLERRRLGSESFALSMPLLPDFWAVITSSPENYRSYTITQKIYPISNDTAQSDLLLFSIHYTMEHGFIPPTYVAPDLPPPPPYFAGLSLHTNAYSPLHFHYPTPLSDSSSTLYFNDAPLAHPAQIPNPMFFPHSMDHELLYLGHELNSLPTYF